MATGISYEESIKRVYRVCGILALVTAVEIIAALAHYSWLGLSTEAQLASKLWLNILFIVLSAAKAYYIMSEFMHLRYELKPLTISVLAPFLFLVWAIIAFSYEGVSWLQLRSWFG
jgi:cytochrome c oxidase subunit 4